jgi:hypothetical protein
VSNPYDLSLPASAKPGGAQSLFLIAANILVPSKED